MQRPYDINTKQDRKDLVTEIDESTEKFIIKKLGVHFQIIKLWLKKERETRLTP